MSLTYECLHCHQFTPTGMRCEWCKFDTAEFQRKLGVLIGQGIFSREMGNRIFSGMMNSEYCFTIEKLNEYATGDKLKSLHTIWYDSFDRRTPEEISNTR